MVSRVARLVAAALVLVLPGAVPALTSSAAADGSPNPADGQPSSVALTSTPLPVRYRTPDSGHVVSHSADYALVDTGRAHQLMHLYRLADGAELAPVTWRFDTTPPMVVDDTIGTIGDESGPSGSTPMATVRSAADGSIEWQLPVRGNAYGGHLDDQWYLSKDQDDVQIAFPDGRTEAVGHVPGYWVAGDSTVAILADQTSSWAIDVATGTTTELTSADGGPVRVVAADDAAPGRPMTVYGIAGSTITRWVDPVHHPVGQTVTVASTPPTPRPSTAEYAVLGGQLLLTTGADYTWGVRPLDFASGTWGTPLVSDASSAQAVGQAGDEVVVARTDATSARLSLLPPTGDLRDVAPILDPEQALDLWRSGNVVTADFGEDGPVGTLPGATWAGGATWSARAPLPPPPDPAGLESAPTGGSGESFSQVAGDLALVFHNGLGTAYHSDGTRVPASGITQLSPNGRWALTEQGVIATDDGRTVLADHDGGAFDGDLFYDDLAADQTVQVHDLTGATSPPPVTLPTGCDPGRKESLVRVRGRWAEISCGGLGGKPSYNLVEDLDDAITSVTTNNYTEIGADYVVTPRLLSSDGSTSTWQLDVIALAAGHETRSTPVLTYTLNAGPVSAVDGTGGADPVYVDPDGRVQDIDVSWVPTPAPPPPAVTPPPPPVDTAAPTVRVTSRAQPIVGRVHGVHVPFAVVAADDTTPADAVDVEVQARRAPRLDGFGDWTDVPRAAAEGGVYARPGEELCYRARATDAAGRTSAWTAPRCSLVPLDDRAVGGSRRQVSTDFHRGYLGSTYSDLLPVGGAGVPLSVVGRTVAVRVLRSPRAGLLLLDDGVHRSVRLHVAAPRRSLSWLVVRMPYPLVPERGLRLRAVSRPVRVDAVAVAR